MLVFASVLALVALSSAAPPMHDGRIVGGLPTTIERFPYQVSMERTGGSHFCGGSIFNEHYIVTAAHCVENRVPQNIKIRVGSTKRGTDGKVYEVASIKAYPGFDIDVLDSDVAVIKLKEPLTFGTGVQPIKLVALNEEPQQGEMLTVTGWGTLESGSNNLPLVLQMVRVPTIDRSLCRLSYGDQRITDTMLCAGVSKKDACQGDSGGPLVNENQELVGIVSWGKGCGYPGYPGIYASVASSRVRNFITENTKA